ncbi:LRR domain containing protein [Parasponia andersonii]|uniref:LRR domain containing protein n=1 Tax=Parasponia andersonii TaxID=3476 RepID=A0A2P5ALE2_PARAD|nr:LRR domain containing protein [Parasponia andersonii]
MRRLIRNICPFPPLFLHGILRKLPKWITRLENLVRIRLYWSKLEDDPLKVLETLPNLLEIALSSDAYDVEELKFEEGAFPRLKVLKICSLRTLRLLVIEE